MRPAPFSIRRALAVTAPVAPAFSAEGLAFRPAHRLDFEEVDLELQPHPSHLLHQSPRFTGLGRISTLQIMQLRGPSHFVVDGGSLMLTYVLRHSPGGMNWRDSWGESSRLNPGSIFIHKVEHDSLVEMAPTCFETPCDCVRIEISTTHCSDMTMCVDASDQPSCDQDDACVNVLLGDYRQHASRICPMPNLSLLDLDVSPLVELELPVHELQSALAILVAGSLQFGGRLLEPPLALAFEGPEPLARIATQTGASLLWFELPARLSSSGESTSPAARQRADWVGRRLGEPRLLS